MTAHLSVRGVSLRFGALAALQDLSLDLAPGEVLGVLGPNGAGKTTLVNAITGFARPQEGRIEFAGTDITGQSPRRIARCGISRSFQATRLFNRLTVQENVEVAALGSGASSREARARASRLLAVLRLWQVAAVRADVLPYGLERRVAIARAAASNPSCLLLDEPAAGMTPSEADELIDDVERAQAHLGCSILLIEHDVAFVVRISTRAVVMHQGRVIADGKPSEVIKQPPVLKAYFGISQPEGPGTPDLSPGLSACPLEPKGRR